MTKGDALVEKGSFLRKLKPSLMVARAKGEAPTDQEPKKTAVPRPRRRGGPNPFLVVGIALAAGIALAKIVDWRSHAHPRD